VTINGSEYGTRAVLIGERWEVANERACSAGPLV
jgi:hypothetical protein